MTFAASDSKSCGQATGLSDLAGRLRDFSLSDAKAIGRNDRNEGHMCKGRAMTEPLFVLGVGAQKAGTTWLQAYLDHAGPADFGAIKEYHIWDGITVPTCWDFDTRRQSQPLRRRLRHLLRPLRGGPVDPFYLRRSMQKDTNAYFDYFEGLLAQDGIVMTGDITPAYCGLSAETMGQIRSGFEARGTQVKVVYLMREPVERCLSAIRMYHRAGRGRQGVDIELPEDEALLAYIETEDGQMRTRYDQTLTTLDAVFDPEHCFIGLYETLFLAPEFERLNRFFGLTPDPTFLERRFNTTKPARTLPDAVRHAAMDRLAPVYEACFDRIPDLATHWPQAAAYFGRG